MPERSSMPVRASRLARLAGWSLLSICAPSVAGNVPDEVRYLSGAFVPVFDDMREFHQLGVICKTRFAADCGRALDARIPGFDTNVAMIDLVTVFEARESRVASREFSGYQDVLALVQPTRDQFMRHLFTYEKTFFERYAAIARVCPKKDLDSTIAAATDVDFLRYWQLTEFAYWGIKQELAAGTAKFERQIRGRWSNERCTKTRELGTLLMAHMKWKLRPYAKDGWEKLTSDERFAQALGFVFLSGIAFEAQVHPEVVKEALQLTGDGER
jgi:hypothetical protein